MAGSVIDGAQLANLLDLMDGESDLVIEVIDLFLEDGPQRVAAIAAAIDTGDPGELMRAAHSLKGSSANVGARGLTGICANLEQRGRNGSVAGAGPLCLSLQREFDAVRDALGAERRRLGDGAADVSEDRRLAV